MIEEIKDVSDKKRKQAAARAIIKKYKTIKKPKKTYLVEEVPQEEISESVNTLFEEEPANESIIEAVNKVFDFKKFKKEQEKTRKKGKASRKITAEKYQKNTKTLKNQKRHIW